MKIHICVLLLAVLLLNCAISVRSAVASDKDALQVVLLAEHMGGLRNNNAQAGNRNRIGDDVSQLINQANQLAQRRS